MEVWQNLIGTALIGTDRQTPVPPEAEDALTTVIAQLDWRQPARALLAAAGAVALHQQVGQCPMKKALPPVEPCTLDDLSGGFDSARPDLSIRTARYLGLAFGEHREVMPELLSLIAAAGQRVPAQWLPKLLQFGQQQPKLRPQIRAVLGQRGQWLAHQNPAWDYGRGQASAEFSPDSPAAQTIWQSGSRSERARFLQRWREVAPDAARAALAATWTSALAKDREALMEGLVHRLSMADEPFLEQALDDRAQDVRKLAIELLVQLPASRLCQRMAERVRTYVQLQDVPLQDKPLPQHGKTVKIKVTLPTHCEKDWVRDGINPKYFEGEGKRARGLSQMLASVPMSSWPGDPTEIVRSMADHQWQNLLLEGWALAAARQKHGDWADALITQWGPQLSAQGGFADLLALFSPDRQEQLLQTTLPQKLALKPSEDEALLAWFGQVTQRSRCFPVAPLSLAFSRLVWAQLIKLIKIRKQHSYTLSGPIRDIALIFHPELAPEAAQVVADLLQDKNVTYLQNALGEMVNRLSFRQEIHQAFLDSG